MTDLIDHLAGILPGSPLDLARAARPAARLHAQESYDLLFHPEETGPSISLGERRALALFTVALSGDAPLIAHYRELLEIAAPSLVAPVLAEAARGQGSGPFGHFPAGPLSVEDSEGKVLVIPANEREALGARLAAGLEHVHLLALHPRDADRAALQRLLDAGWSTEGIVTLSQIASFLAFQIRIVQGLRLARQARDARPDAA